MRIVLQRVSKASISINGGVPEHIESGLVALVGINNSDNEQTADYMINKMINLRIFEDDKGAMNLSLLDTDGDLLVVSNFTLYANSKKGRRPSFIEAGRPEHAEPLFDYLVSQLNEQSIKKVVSGEFGAYMKIDLCNDGPVTIILDSDEIMPNKS